MFVYQSIRTVKSAFISLLVLFSSYGFTHEAKKGEHYEVLTPTIISADSTARIVKYFSLSCHPCKMMNEFLPQLERETGKEIDKEHVVYNDNTKSLATIYYSAKVQSEIVVDTSFMKDLFSQVQSRTVDQGNIANLFQRYGLKAPETMTVQQNEMVTKQVVQSEWVMSNTSINAVPGFVVDGKYLVKLDRHRSIEEMAATMKYLLALSPDESS
ncbi:thioredoxin domain-containing protein [Photobacterium satsumensis]|uniref:thioredoxin domain-containing protein n=1 Tax=Photobacterium satsumensis TaxID=2910239 RepID=UPI003D0EF95E